MGCGAWTAAHAEGVLLAADESDARALHFDGGLPATATLLAAIHRSVLRRVRRRRQYAPRLSNSCFACCTGHTKT